VSQSEQIDAEVTLKEEQERLAARKQVLQTELAQIDQKLDRINRYFSGTTGPTQITRHLQGEGHLRGFIQATVLKTVSGHPQGLTSREVTELLKPDNISQKSIYNALGTLVFTKKVTFQGRGGKYRLASAETLSWTPKNETGG